MRLLSLKLRFFKKHVALDVDFTAGVNGVFGPNYRGKSSLLHGIMYCLGGASALPRGMSVENDNMTKTDKFRQTMTFGDDRHQYLVVRTKTEAKLYEGLEEDKEKVLATGTVAVNARIEAILGTDIKTFKSLRYAEQKKTDAILTLGVSKLHAIVDQITGVEDVNTALVKLSAMQQAFSARVSARPFVPTEEIELQMGANGAKLQEIEAALEEASRISEETRAELVAVNAAAAEANASHTRILEQLREAEQQVAAAAAAKAARDALAEEHAQAEEAFKEAEARFLETEEVLVGCNMEGLVARKDALSKEAREVAGAVAVWKALVKDIERLTSEQAQRQVTIDKARDQLELLPFNPFRHDEMMEAFQTAKAAHTGAAQRLDALSKAVAAGTCSACHRPFDDCQDSVAEQQAAISTLQAEVDILAAVIEAARKEAGDSNDRKAEHEKADQRLQDALKAYAAGDEQLKAAREKQAGCPVVRDEAAIQADLDQVDRELVQLRSAESARDQAKLQLDRIAPRLQAAEASYAACKAPSENDVFLWQESLQAAAACRDAAQAAVEVANGSRDLAIERLQALTAHAAELRQTQASLRNSLQNALTNNELRQSDETSLNAVKGLLKFLRDNRDRYVAETWDKFTAVASQFCSGCTDGAIESITRDADGDFSYVEEGKRRSIEDASGAQKSIMGLGIQYALAMAAPCPLDIIIVDEPTADMDAEHSLATVLMLSTAGSQVVMISHSQMDNAACDNVISL